MRRFSSSSANGNAAQVVSVGNVYESAVLEPIPYQAMSALFQADERHLSQKSAYWLSQYGFPTVAVCTAAPSSPAKFVPARHFICPRRTSSSICLDLLADHDAKQGLLRVLDKGKPVHLTPYSFSRQISAVAHWLEAEGYALAEWPSQMAELTRLYSSKVTVQSELFAADKELAADRKSVV